MSSKINKLQLIKVLRISSVKDPIRIYLAIVLSMSWIILTALSLNNQPLELGLILVTYLGLFGLSILITFWENGRTGVKQFLGGLVKWRVGLRYYLLALISIPLLTIAIAAITGNLHVTKDNVLPELTGYIISLLSGALIINLWEETGWAGFVQTKLMKQKGLLVGSILTAPAFVAIHMPLLLKESNFSDLMITFSVMLGLSFFFRYLIGMILIDTAGSLLIIGLLHASFNSSNGLKIVTGEFEVIIATIFLTLCVAVYRNIRRKYRVAWHIPS